MIILLCGLCRASFAVILFFIPSPLDDSKACAGLCLSPELKPLQAAYDDIIQTRLWPLKLDDIAKIFGPKLDTASNWWSHDPGVGGKSSGPGLEKQPADFVVPVFASGSCWGGGMGMTVSGLHSTNPADNKNHTDLHAVGDIGYVEFFYANDGARLQNAALCFRADKEFVPLTSTNELSKRLVWEKAKFDALKKWLDEHMPKLNDLGVVELSESSPLRLDLGAGTACSLTTRILHAPTVTNLWYSIDICKQTPDPNGKAESLQSKSIDRAGESIGFSMDGKFYRLTPKLVEQTPEPNK